MIIFKLESGYSGDYFGVMMNLAWECINMRFLSKRAIEGTFGRKPLTSPFRS